MITGLAVYYKNVCGIVVLGTYKWVYCCIKENHLFHANLPCLFSVIPAAVCMLLCLILVVILYRASLVRKFEYALV